MGSSKKKNTVKKLADKLSALSSEKEEVESLSLSDEYPESDDGGEEDFQDDENVEELFEHYHFTVYKGQSMMRLDKYITSRMFETSRSRAQMAIEAGYVRVGGKVAKSNYKIKPLDEISLVFPYEKRARDIGPENIPLDIVYEDDDFLIVNKPYGILSQKSAPSDLSVNEWIVGYLLSKKALTIESLSVCRPSITNRLDRNTSGIILAGKTVYGLQVLSEMIRDRLIKKYYLAYVTGFLDGEATLIGYHLKCEKNNTSTIIDCDSYERLNESQKSKYSLVKTAYTVLDHYKLFNTDITSVELDLITGKSHQIRVHMSSIGHPLLGDNKYGDTKLNRKLGLKHQLLHAYKIVFPDDKRLNLLSKRTITCPHGNQEVFEALFSKN